MMRKIGWFAFAVVALTTIGSCASKNYVAQQIAASEARTSSEISAVENRTELNAEEIGRLVILSEELAAMTNVAINEARGFEDYEIAWEGSVTYDFDSYRVDDAADRTLVECAGKLASATSSVLEIAGHTDRTGSADYNLVLGEKRAQAVRRFLAERFGVSLYRMFAISHGEDQPADPAQSRDANARNRRATLRIWAKPPNMMSPEDEAPTIDPSL